MRVRVIYLSAFKVSKRWILPIKTITAIIKCIYKKERKTRDRDRVIRHINWNSTSNFECETEAASDQKETKRRKGSRRGREIGREIRRKRRNNTTTRSDKSTVGSHTKLNLKKRPPLLLQKFLFTINSRMHTLDRWKTGVCDVQIFTSTHKRTHTRSHRFDVMNRAAYIMWLISIPCVHVYVCMWMRSRTFCLYSASHHGQSVWKLRCYLPGCVI